MSVFGDGRYQMNQLGSDIEYFFDEGGTLSEFFEVIDWYFRNTNFKKEE